MVPIKTQYARDLRRKMTKAELILWPCLRKKRLEVKFRRQHVIGGYIVDFSCPAKNLIIEVDGKYHEDSWVVVYDIKRTKDLNTYGYRVIRFKNEEVENNLKDVLSKIKSELFSASSDLKRSFDGGNNHEGIACQ